MKDPGTYFKLVTQGQELTKADERQFWDNIKKYQQKTLSDKRIKHRNFGEYSKHNCGRDNCHLNGIMIRQDSDISYGKMHFDSDKHPYSAKIKSEQRRKDRKKSKQNIKRILDSEYNKSI